MVPLVDVFKFNLILRQCERDNKAFRCSIFIILE